VKLSLTNNHSRLNPHLKKIEDTLYKLKELSKRSRKRVDIILTDDKCIADLAGKYRNSPRATDVLSFYYGDENAKIGAPVGEIVISLDTAKRQAKERNVKIEDELILLSVHGLLHLGGQEDETPDAWAEMKRLEFEALSKIL